MGLSGNAFPNKKRFGLMNIVSFKKSRLSYLATSPYKKSWNEKYFSLPLQNYIAFATQIKFLKFTI